MDDDFFFAPHAERDHLRIRLAGELDVSVAARAKSLDLHPGAPIVVDLSGLSFIDSTGLGALVPWRHEAEDGGRAFRIELVPDHVRRTIDATGLASHLGLA